METLLDCISAMAHAVVVAFGSYLYGYHSTKHSLENEDD